MAKKSRQELEALNDTIVDMLMEGRTHDEIHEALDVSTGYVSKVRRSRGLSVPSPGDMKPGKRVVTDYGDKAGSLRAEVCYVSGKKPRWLDTKNPDELLKACGVDTKTWYAHSCRVSSSEVTMKLKRVVDKISTHTPRTYTNVHVSVQLRRREPSERAIFKLADKLMSRKWKPSKIKYRVTKKPVLLEWCPFDHHHGLLAWKPEVEASWDLKISERFFDEASKDVLNKSAPYNIAQVLIPIGQDWFHCDDPTFTTPGAKHRLDMDGRLIKVFETGYWSLFRGIERFRQIAPVHLIWVPGNHDPQTSYYLCRTLAAHYMDVDGKFRRGVTVDFSPRSRKLYRWGNSAIGFSHPICKGHWEKQRGIFAELFKQEWADAQHHEIHTGHLHKIMEFGYMQADTLGSHTVIRMLPSLCASDKWHHEMGFLDKNRASASFIWSDEEGLVCQFTTRVKE